MQGLVQLLQTLLRAAPLAALSLPSLALPSGAAQVALPPPSVAGTAGSADLDAVTVVQGRIGALASAVTAR